MLSPCSAWSFSRLSYIQQADAEEKYILRLVSSIYIETIWCRQSSNGNRLQNERHLDVAHQNKVTRCDFPRNILYYVLYVRDGGRSPGKEDTRRIDYTSDVR